MLTIELTFGWGHGLWKKALRQGIAIAAGVTMANMADSPGLPLYSPAWFRHAGLAALTAFIMTELMYIKNWGHRNGNGNDFENHKSNRRK